MNEFIPCNKCSNGYIINVKDGVAKKCSCLKLFQQKSKINIELERANIKDFNLTFEDYVGKKSCSNIYKLKQYCEKNELKTNSHLYFYGSNGTQKTTVAKIILKEYILQGKSAKFILMSDLLDILTDVFSSSPTRESELEHLRNVDILVIDDAFDNKKVTMYKSGYQLSFIDRFIRTRIEVIKKNTIFTSNVAINDIVKNGFTSDIENLLQRSIVIRGGYFLFEDVYISEENNVDIKSLWD